MFEKTKTFLIKNERKLWTTGVCGLIGIAGYYKLVNSNNLMNVGYLHLALDEMNLTVDVVKKVAEIMMRDDF